MTTCLRTSQWCTGCVSASHTDMLTSIQGAQDCHVTSNNGSCDIPNWAALEMCLLRFASQFALSAAEAANTWKDLSAWLIWNALEGSEKRNACITHDALYMRGFHTKLLIEGFSISIEIWLNSRLIKTVRANRHLIKSQAMLVVIATGNNWTIHLLHHR